MSVSTTQSNSTTPDDTWTDTAGIVHEEYILVDNATTIKINCKTGLGSDLISEISQIDGSATITGTLVTSVGATFTNVSATATFDQAADNGDGNLVNISGTAVKQHFNDFQTTHRSSGYTAIVNKRVKCI